MPTNPYEPPQEAPLLEGTNRRGRIFWYWWQPYGCGVQLVGWLAMLVLGLRRSLIAHEGLARFADEHYTEFLLAGMVLIFVPGVLLVYRLYRDYGKHTSGDA